MLRYLTLCVCFNAALTCRVGSRLLTRISVFSYYNLTLSAGHEDVMFVLTRTYGDPDLFINNNGAKAVLRH